MLSASFSFSVFLILHCPCCQSFRSSVKILTRSKGFFGLLLSVWNAFSLGYGTAQACAWEIFLKRCSAMLQGINADQIFLAYLWECLREYKKKKKVMLMFITSIASLLSISLQLCQRNKLCQFDTTLFPDKSMSYVFYHLIILEVLINCSIICSRIFSGIS